MIAAIATAAMLPTGMVFTMVMVVVVAPDIGIIFQLAFDNGSNRSIGVAGYATIQLDAGCCQRHLRATADTATDQHIRIQRGKDTG